MIVSGIPVFSGLYNEEMASKYGFLQVLACFGGLLPFIYFSFELASTDN